jgi:shikimate kinase
MPRNEPILIGPVGVGKTTTSKLLAERLGVPRVSMDEVLFKYMAEAGFDENHWKHVMEKLGRTAGYRYLKVFGAYGVKRILEEHKDCVFDFGGGGVIGDFPDEFERIKQLLGEFENVVFLIPSENKADSLKFLYERLKIQTTGWTILEHLVYHPSHDELAKHKVFVAGRTPEEVCELILDRIKPTASPLQTQ